MQPQFEEYPKVMHHPNFVPASHKVLDDALAGGRLAATVQGKPAVLPPVTVEDLDQEEFYASRGYVPAGQSDPRAFDHAATMGPSAAASALVIYPKWKYHATEPATVVESADAERALGDEWADRPDLVGQSAQAEADKPPAPKARRRA